MSIKLDSRVAPSFHPVTVTKIDGYSEAIAIYVAPTERIPEDAYNGVSVVHPAMDAAKNDPTLNDAARIIKADDLAQKVFGNSALGPTAAYRIGVWRLVSLIDRNVIYQIEVPRE
jgi:hypothetical protein